MNTTIAAPATPKFDIKYDATTTKFIVTRDGQPLTQNGTIRRFTTRASARKRISREISGKFHN